jgi:hypothetical protein
MNASRVALGVPVTSCETTKFRARDDTPKDYTQVMLYCFFLAAFHGLQLHRYLESEAPLCKLFFRARSSDTVSRALH